MSCTYTGAVVFFENYGATVVADLFEVGDVCIIQWMPDSYTYNSSEIGRPLTHAVNFPLDVYHHTARGVTVVPKANISAVKLIKDGGSDGVG